LAHSKEALNSNSHQYQRLKLVDSFRVAKLDS
jgi:hypothetical protein